MEINALAARGWSVSAISRHTGRDRKTVRSYLSAPRAARAPAPSCLEPFRAYVAARFEDDPHLEATVLHRELVDAGFARAYTTLVGELGRLGLRPLCLVCAHRRGAAVTTEIDHPPGEEIQWDWLELAAADVPWGEQAYVLVGALSHSGRFRGVFCEQMTFGHLAGAMHLVLVALGGTPRVWRTDRMATIVSPQSGRITPDAAALAKHYGAQLAVCPARRAQRKGVVEAAIKYLTRSWWRTAAVATIGDAQRDLDAWSARVADTRERLGATVGEIGAGESLRALPSAAYPAQIIVQRKASRAALTAFEGNQYSVPPAHAGKLLTVIAQAAGPVLRIVSAHGEIVAEHRRVPAGAGQTVRSSEHAAMLQDAVLAAFTTKDACRRKPNLPPGDSALAELARLRGLDPGGAQVISLADYATLAEAAAR
ncbi:MAG: IS21 family transposase [Actinobacteria bacterium]|nr:IS21 family transposase [Actinomycetota bacterium]